MEKPLIIDKSLVKISRIEKFKIKKFVEDFERTNSESGMGILSYEPIYCSNNLIVYSALVCEMFNTNQGISCTKQVDYVICDKSNQILLAKYTTNKNSNRLFSNINCLEVLDANNSDRLHFSSIIKDELMFAKSAINAKKQFVEKCR